MKRSFLYLVIVSLFASAFSTSCSNEVEVIGEWKEIPIVYGVINPSPLDDPNPTHYFRIEKAFLDPKTDAFVIATRADSLYYGENDIDVIIYEYEHNDPCKLITTDTLERVVAEDEGFGARDTGIFARSPNILYKTDAQFTNGYYFRLQIINNVTGKEFNSYTRGVYTSAVDNPGQSYNAFSILSPSTSKALKWNYYDEGTSQWIFNDINTRWEEPINGTIYDLSVILHYDEYEVDDNGAEVPGTREDKILTWNPIKNYIRPGNTGLIERCRNSGRLYNIYSRDDSPAQQELSGENFFRFLASRLSDVSGTNTRRCAGYVDLRVDCAGPELAEYLDARNANQNLIGGLFPVDPFSNIDGGYGVFTTKSYVWKKDFLLDVEVLEYLNLPEGITGSLGFENTACY